MRLHAVTGLVCVPTLLAAAAFADAPLRLNEIRLEQPGADFDEYVELAGAPGQSLSGLTLIVIGDDDLAKPGQQNGVVEMAVGLKGRSVGASGFFVIGEPTLSLATPDLATSLNLEGGDNLTVLLVSGFSGFVGQKLDANDDGVLDVTPWTAVVSSLAIVGPGTPDGISSDFYYATTTVGPDGDLVPSAAWLCSNSPQWIVGDVDPFAGHDTPGAANPACAVDVLRINEARIDQTGTDNDEYFELKGGPGTSLSDLTYIVIGDGSSGTTPSGFIEAIVPLAGQSIPGSGYFVCAETTFTLGVANYVVGATGLNFENSDNVTHMLVRGFTGTLNQDLDTNDDGTLDLTPWAEIVDSFALVNPTASGTQDKVYSANAIGPDATFWPGHVYRCTPDATWSIGPFNPIGGKDTPGAANAACTTCGNGAGNCHAVHATPGCVDAACCNAVCVIDPTCCSEGWDQACVNQARASCLAAGTAPALAFNEIRIDEPGNVDPNEYVEITGAPGTSLNGVSLVILGDGADANGNVEAVVSLSGAVIPKDGILLVAESGFTLGIPDVVRSLNLENGDSVTYLLVFNFLGLANVDLDANNDCTLDAQPWDALIDSLAIKAGDGNCTYAPTSVGPDYVGLPSHVLKCLDGAWRFGTFEVGVSGAFDTPGSPNLVCPPAYACGNPKGPSCYSAHAAPGCSDEDCCRSTCQIDPTCCELTWDSSCASTATLLCFVPTEPPAVELSEIRIDQTLSDTDEFFELRGEPGTLLNGLAYVVIGDGASTAGSGVIEFVQPLQGMVIPKNGYFLAAHATFTLGGATPDLVLPPQPELENSDNVTHMLVFDFTGTLNQDLDLNDDGTLDVTPWGAVVQSVAFIESAAMPPSGTEWAYGSVRVGPDPNGFVPSQLAYCPTSGAWTIGTFIPDAVHVDSPGAPNYGCDYDANACPTDVDGDGATGASDLAAILGAWGTSSPDLDGDGTVGASDLAAILGGWGPCR